MDLLLFFVAILFIFLGVVGSFLPVLPGPLTSWAGLLTLHFIDAIPMDRIFLIITLVIAIIIWFLDYVIPVIGAKQFGGSKYGIIGTSIGLLVGLIAPIPFGIVIGPFFGALLGEFINKSKSKTAVKAALGSFIGFLTSTFIKFIVAIIYLGLFLVKIWDHKQAMF